MSSESLLQLFVAGFVLSLALTPLFIRAAHKLDIVDRPAHRKTHTKTVAYLGGAAVFTSILVAGLGLHALTGFWNGFDPGSKHKIVFILFSSLGVMALGLLDDMFQVRARYRLLGQAFFATAFALLGYRFEVLHIPGLPMVDLGLLAVPLTVFWMVSIINAFNMIDGSDGLAVSVSTISLVLIAGASAYLGNFGSMSLCLLAASVLLGFLAYNWNPAKIYLGDAGSGGLGMLIAASLLGLGRDMSYLMYYPVNYPAASQPFHYHIFILTLFVAYPAMEILSTVARRLLHGRPLGRADRGHVHHRLLEKNFTPKEVSMVALGVASLIGLAGVAIIWGHNGKAAWLLAFGGTLVGIGVSQLGFLNFLSPKVIQRRRPHYQIANHFIEMQRVKLGLAQAREEVLSLLKQTCDEFGVKSFRLVIPSDKAKKGGLDYSHAWDPDRQLHLGFLQIREPARVANLIFSDQCRLPKHKGAAQWVFEPHTEEEDLDVEYRVLVHEFMNEALEKVVRLGAGQDTLEVPSVAPLSNKPLSGHALRKRHS